METSVGYSYLVFILKSGAAPLPVGPTPNPTVQIPPQLKRSCALHSDKEGLLPGVNFEAWTADASSVSEGARRCQLNQGPLLEMVRGARTQAERDAIVRDLGLLPPEAVQGLHDGGLRIVLFDLGQKQLDASSADVSPPRDLNQLASHPKARAYVQQMAARQQEERQRAELITREGGPQLLEERKRLMELHSKVQSGLGLPAAPSPELQAQSERVTRIQQSIERKHNLKPLEPLPPAPQGYRRQAILPSFDPQAKIEPFPGYGTEAEQKAYRQAMGRLNQGLDLKVGGEVLVPQGEFYRGFRSHEEASRLRDLDAGIESINQGKANASFTPWQNTILIPRTLLADPAPDYGHTRVLLHEVGHAVDFALEKEDPKKRDQIRQQVYASERASDYANTNPHEAYAEAFEARFTRHREDGHERFNHGNLNQAWLHRQAPGVEAQIDQDLANMARLRKMALGGR